MGNQNSSFKKTHKNLNKCPCGIRELKAQQLKGEVHGRAPVHCTSSTWLPWGLTKCKKATGNPELCVRGREKIQTHAQSRGTEGEKGKLPFEAADAREISRGLGWFFFVVQILALVKALSIKMCGLFNPTLQERLACFVIKQNFIKAMSHIIL